MRLVQPTVLASLILVLAAIPAFADNGDDGLELADDKKAELLLRTVATRADRTLSEVLAAFGEQDLSGGHPAPGRPRCREDGSIRVQCGGRSSTVDELLEDGYRRDSVTRVDIATLRKGSSARSRGACDDLGRGRDEDLGRHRDVRDRTSEIHPNRMSNRHVVQDHHQFVIVVVPSVSASTRPEQDDLNRVCDPHDPTDDRW